MIVVADTSPVNYLVLIGEIQVLPLLYKRVLIPRAVYDELGRAKAPEPVRRWISAPPAWLEIAKPTLRPGEEFARLGIGEVEAILLAEELRVDRLIIDEVRGRRTALARGLSVTGTIGVLKAAADSGLLDFKDAVGRLRQTSFHVSQDVLDLLQS